MLSPFDYPTCITQPSGGDDYIAESHELFLVTSRRFHLKDIYALWNVRISSWVEHLIHIHPQHTGIVKGWQNQQHKRDANTDGNRHYLVGEIAVEGDGDKQKAIEGIAKKHGHQEVAMLTLKYCATGNI